MASSLFNKRILRLVSAQLTVILVLVIRLLDVQAVNASGYQERANGELYRTTTLLAPRGEITDVNGIPYAHSISAINIVVDQTMIVDPNRTAQIAAPILGMTESEVLSKIVGKKRWFLVARDATPAQWNALKDAFANYNYSLSKKDFGKRIVGFFSERNYTREYPAEIGRAHV